MASFAGVFLWVKLEVRDGRQTLTQGRGRRVDGAVAVHDLSLDEEWLVSTAAQDRTEGRKMARTCDCRVCVKPAHGFGRSRLNRKPRRGNRGFQYIYPYPLDWRFLPSNTLATTYARLFTDRHPGKTGPFVGRVYEATAQGQTRVKPAYLGRGFHPQAGRQADPLLRVQGWRDAGQERPGRCLAVEWSFTPTGAKGTYAKAVRVSSTPPNPIKGMGGLYPLGSLSKADRG